jgi:hypothetical protein
MHFPVFVWVLFHSFAGVPLMPVPIAVYPTEQLCAAAMSKYGATEPSDLWKCEKYETTEDRVYDPD